MIDYGTTNFEGRKYTLTQDAYYESGYGNGFSEFFTDVDSGKMEYYTANAVDENGERIKCTGKSPIPTLN